MNRVAIFIFLFFVGGVMAKEQLWLTGKFEYDGYPLHLRVPKGLSYDELSLKFPKFISVTHSLSQTTDNGLPVSEYNNTLGDFDEFLIKYLENTDSGITVLVETFGGNRVYYMYSNKNFDVSKLKSLISQKYSQHKVEIDSNMDDKWSFIKQYSEDWGF